MITEEKIVCLHTKQVVFAMLSITVIGCTPLGDQGPGPYPAEVPPKLILRDGFKVWDNPRAFGPVPKELVATGEKVCATMNMGAERYLPKGYHPKALDYEGIEFLGGGYYCVNKSN